MDLNYYLHCGAFEVLFMCTWFRLSLPCASSLVLLCHTLCLCVFYPVCTVRHCWNTSRLRRNGGGVWPTGPNLVFSLSLCKEKRRGRKIIGQRASERYTAVIARTRSETRVMRNPILTVCRAPTQPSLLPPTRFELLKNCLRWAPPHCRLTGKPPNEKMENSFVPFLLLFHYLSVSLLCFLSDPSTCRWDNSLFK